ncbi:MAG: hypothetical protein Q8R18_04605 [bacterium]|nr:hypothetical protein [bacterium]
MAILDTGFLSSFFKVGKLDFFLKVLDVKHVVIPSTVYEELKKAKFFDEMVCLFAFSENDLDNKRFILVKNVDLIVLQDGFTDEERIMLGKGELGCFVLANESGETIFVDDSKARTIAKEKGLKVVSLPSFLLYSKRKHFTSLEELKEIIHDLKAKDCYEFSEDVKMTLLE